MELYLIKSTSILGILFLFYKVALENTSLHSLKRFYLVGIVILACSIPLITITKYIEVPAIIETVQQSSISYSHPQNTNQKASLVYVNNWSFVLWTLYSIGVLLFLVRFCKNIWHFVQKIKHNEKLKKDFFYVLLHKKTIPHTFLNYIFLEKKAFVANSIPKEILLHEETHAKQKHSLDLIFFELFQIVFWFNPLFYFIKKSSKLNHEFLADSAVLNNGVSTTLYQQLLLSLSSLESTPALANAINYSSFKKRFILMKTHTSKRDAKFRTLLLLPLVGILIYAFSSAQVIENKTNKQQNYAKDNGEMSTISQKPPIFSTNPIDQVIRLTKEHAAFTYEDEPISHDKAIALIKNNPDLYILVRRFEKSNPIVDLTTEKVIFIENANKWENPIEEKTATTPKPDPASYIETYIQEGAKFYSLKEPITPDKAKEIMRNDAPTNLKIRTTKDGKKVVILQGC